MEKTGKNCTGSAAGEDFLEFTISEGMATTMNGSDTALIIGGDITITRIQIKAN